MHLGLSAAPLGEWYRETVAAEAMRLSAAEASPPSPADLAQRLERGLGHLRTAGISYRLSGDGRWARLLPEGVHPYAAVLRDLAGRGIGVIFYPDATGDGAGAVAEPDVQVFGFKAVILGLQALLALDPESSALAHEVAHLDLPKRAGETPYAGGFAASDTNPTDRPPGPATGLQDTYLAEEMAAYPVGLCKELEGLATTLRNGAADVDERLAAANAHTVHGLVVALQTIACDKQMLGRLGRGALQELPPALGPGGDSQHHFLVRRGNGRTYLAVLTTAATPLHTGVQAALLHHLSWQLRVATEHLALMRVVGQAIDHAKVHRDARFIDAALHVLRSGRAAASADATPVTYAEALAAFNGDIAAAKP